MVKCFKGSVAYFCYSGDPTLIPFWHLSQDNVPPALPNYYTTIFKSNSGASATTQSTRSRSTTQATSWAVFQFFKLKCLLFFFFIMRIFQVWHSNVNKFVDIFLSWSLMSFFLKILTDFWGKILGFVRVCLLNLSFEPKNHCRSGAAVLRLNMTQISVTAQLRLLMLLLLTWND